MGDLEMAPPWAVYAGRVKALFADDPGVTVGYSEDSRKVTLLVEGVAKADAISRLLPSEVEYGDVRLAVEVIPSNREPSEAEAFEAAFHGNPKFHGMASGGPAGDVPYALFEPSVVQLFEDDISKYMGCTTLTFEELARSVVEQGDVRICSAPGVNVD